MVQNRTGSDELLSTGRAAALLSVTPDTVLKWVKANKIKGIRTPGGHYRIRRSEILSMIPLYRASAGEDSQKRAIRFCWELKSGNGDIPSACHDCLLYRASGDRCYEMSPIPDAISHSVPFCNGVCEECEYYKFVSGQDPNLLLITNRTALRNLVELSVMKYALNLRVIDCEYHCSMLVEKYRPDYVIIDCTLGSERVEDFVKYISEDPRIPFARIIVAGDQFKFQGDCDKMIFAHVKKPLSLKVFEELISVSIKPRLE